MGSRRWYQRSLMGAALLLGIFGLTACATKRYVGEEVSRLKQETGGDLFVHGSARLVQTLLEHDLIDELRLMVFPVVLGRGKRLFGVVTNTRRATRQSSWTNRRWASRPPPTCSTTAFEKATSNSPSAKGSSRPSARTAVIPGNAARKRSSSVMPTAVIRSGHG